jgi:CDP-glucose 4,6-dehydratase
MVTAASAGFWPGKRVLVTGHTGFKGAWLSLWLRRLGAEVVGLALPAERDGLFNRAALDQDIDSHIGDVRDPQTVQRLVRAERPQIVFHLAAQALVRASYADPLGTLDTNVRGTAHVLEALRNVQEVRVAVIVTTDKVYRQDGTTKRAFREDDPLGGHDPYSASKAAAEVVVASYRDAFLRQSGIAVSSARAGNVIGGGDWAADRLIPDAVRAWSQDACLMVRHPTAVRPWQHVLEPLHGYLKMAERTWAQPAHAGAYNIGPAATDAAQVSEVLRLAVEAFGRGSWQQDQRRDAPHEAAHLTLDATRADEVLGIRPRWALASAVRRTMAWYRHAQDGTDARSACLNDIVAYEGAA